MSGKTPEQEYSEQESADIDGTEDPQAAVDQSAAEEKQPGQEPEQAEDAAEEGDELQQALNQLAAAEEAAGRARDDLLRVQAEMQNLRRRTEQDIEKAHKYGQEKFSIELLAVMDNLERAL